MSTSIDIERAARIQDDDREWWVTLTPLDAGDAVEAIAEALRGLSGKLALVRNLTPGHPSRVQATRLIAEALTKHGALTWVLSPADADAIGLDLDIASTITPEALGGVA